MTAARFYLYIMLGAVLGVLVCIMYCALVRASEAEEHEENQGEHVTEETSTKGEKS